MTTLATSSSPQTADDGYGGFLVGFQKRVEALGSAPLFTTSAEGLFQAFLDNLPPAHRQHYTCHACRRFVDTYGGLATIDEAGALRSVMFAPDDVYPFFMDAILAVCGKVESAKVTGVFYSSEAAWGQPVTGEWKHMAATPPASRVFRATALKTAFQAGAEKIEDYKMLLRGLDEFPPPVVSEALRVLKADAVDRSEKAVSAARWLIDLHNAREGKHGRERENVTWLAVAKAPPGFCHVRSNMIGTLLEDIQAGLGFDAIKRRWNEKMNPLQYQRPTAPPSDGQIAQAEKVVAELQATGSLSRRFARLADIVALWKPSETVVPQKPASEGVFGHLKSQGRLVIPVALPETTKTWEKFRDTVLPEAAKIEFYVPTGRDSYVSLVTAANHESAPLLQWDVPDRRNPVSWYFYHGGAAAADFNLTAREWVKVTAITLKPSSWHEPEKHKHQGDAAFVLLEGAKDKRHVRGGGFFPECLRSEFHGVRKTMEAYAQSATIAGRDEGDGFGIGLQKGATWECRLRVTAKDGTVATYRLDRWE